MVDFGLMGFVVLAVVAIVVSAVLHYGFNLRLGDSFSDYVYILIWCYVGAWLGVVLFGNDWFPGDAFAGIPYVPAIIGAVAAHFVITRRTAYLK